MCAPNACTWWARLDCNCCVGEICVLMLTSDIRRLFTDGLSLSGRCSSYLVSCWIWQNGWFWFWLQGAGPLLHQRKSAHSGNPGLARPRGRPWLVRRKRHHGCICLVLWTFTHCVHLKLPFILELERPVHSLVVALPPGWWIIRLSVSYPALLRAPWLSWSLK